MPTSTFTATELKYASGSSWTSGRAKQGVYSDTRFEGAIRFPDLANLPYGNIAISQITLTCTFGSSGGSSNKYLTLYEGAKTTITGTISSMRGASIGAVVVQDAYSAIRTVTFNSSTNAGMFANMTDFFSGGGIILILYVPTTRGTYSGGYCYDYLSVTAASLTITYMYLKSDGVLVPFSVDAGTSATLNITAYNSAYSHNVTWTFGSYSYAQSVAAGETSASYTIPLSWLDTIPSLTSGEGSVTLETLDAGSTSLGTNSYPITITVPASVVPTITSISATPSNENSVIAGWGIFAQGKTKANLAIVGAAGKYGSTIKSYSITTSPSIGSATTPNTQTALIYQTGTITITGTVTDTRERTVTKTATINVYPYMAPSFAPVDICRCTSAGVRDDINGTYVRIKATFGCSALSGSNAATGQVTISQIGGSYVSTTTIVSGTGYTLGGGSIAVDATFSVVFAITDTVGSATPYSAEINSAAYIIHVKKGGAAIGFGMAAGADETASFGWAVKMATPLAVSEGGTGGETGAAACANLGAVKKSGDAVTGRLALGKGAYVQGIVGTGGTAGYFYVCRLTITNSYANAPVEIDIAQRGLRTSARLYIRFVNVADADPALDAFYYSGSCSGAYIVKAAAGTWDVYVTKTEAYDALTVLEYRAPVYMDRLTVAWQDAQVSTLPAGYTQALYGYGDTVQPVSGGGTGASAPKDALTNLGIFYAATLPASGIDGHICLVPVS